MRTKQKPTPLQTRGEPLPPPYSASGVATDLRTTVDTAEKIQTAFYMGAAAGTRHIQAYIKRQSIEKVVQDALRHGTVATSTPTRSTPINTGTKPPRSQPPLLSLLAKGKQSCQACASADNCILFGFDNPSPAKTKQLMLEQEIGRAEATRSMAASSSITPPFPLPAKVRKKAHARLRCDELP